MADIIDLETYKQLLEMRFYLRWRQTLDSDVPYEIYTQIEFIVTAEAEPLDAQTREFLREFFTRGDDAFHFTL